MRIAEEKIEVEDVTATQKEGDRWSVRWTEVIRRRRRFTRNSKREVNGERNRLLKLEAKSTQQVAGMDDLHIDNTAESWRIAHETVGNALIKATVDGDDVSAKRLKRLSSALGPLLNGALSIMGVEMLEHDLEEAQALIKEFRRRIATEHASKPPAGRQNAPGVGRSDGPTDALCGPDPTLPS